MKLTERDEYLHHPPDDSGRLWSDNFWFSVCDREADIFGLNHIHASLSHGYVRASAFYVIDGVAQQWASRQPLDCAGSFEAYGGRRAGERRPISCWSHRDHSWTHRFVNESSWEPRRRRTAEASWGHFWPSVQLPERHLNSFGWMSPTQPIPEDRAYKGGWVADAAGARPIRDATCVPRMEDDERTAMAFTMTFELADGEKLTVLTGRKWAQTRNGLMRDENDAEVRLDCYEPFFDFEVLETGERGYGVVEYSVHPPHPRFRY